MTLHIRLGKYAGGLFESRRDFDNANVFESKFQQAQDISGCSAGGRTAFEKVGRKLRLPDDFCQSKTGIDNFRPALAKVGRKFEKLAGIPKSRAEIENSSRKRKIPAGNSQSQTAFWKSKPAFRKSQTTFKKDGQLQKKSDGN
jgi:hypothetical protein